MSNKIIQLLSGIEGIQDIKIEYSTKNNILSLFSEKKFYIIENINEDPKIRVEIDRNFNLKKTILHPNNENQLILIEEQGISLIKDLNKISREGEIKKLNIPNINNIISIKFSYFDNAFGVLYKDNSFIYYLLKENNELEEICNIKDLDKDYIDFNFCPLFSKGFDIFMVFFMTPDGGLDMYGPFFPTEFSIPKEFIFNMENYLIYKLSTTSKNKENNPQNTIYCLSLNVIDDLKKAIKEDKSDRYNDFIKISDKMKIFNTTFRRREIKIHNNFLVNSNSEILNKNYKQIHILNKRPLTILRISDKNDIDMMMLTEEIMPLELAQSGNFTNNMENKINNFFIEFIRLNVKNEIYKDPIKIMQHDNKELYIKTKNSLFLVKIPYLDSLKKIAEENLKYLPNKMNKISVVKLFKWNNEKNEDRNNQKPKSINVCDILIVPDFKRMFVFGILKEKEDKKFDYTLKINQKANNKLNNKFVYTLKIKEKEFKKESEQSDLSEFNNILNLKNEYDNQITEIKDKLNKNEFINSENIKNTKIVVDEDIIENNNDFEKQFNNELKFIYETYKNLIINTDGIFKQKIGIMKSIYNNISDSDIKKAVDETNKKIEKLKKIKEEIEEKNKIIDKKVATLKEKVNKYELKDSQINNYLDILEKYQNETGQKLNEVNRKIEYLENNIIKKLSYIYWFPNNFDLEFNLIEKDNQNKYLDFEQKVMSNSKTMSEALQKIK